MDLQERMGNAHRVHGLLFGAALDEGTEVVMGADGVEAAPMLWLGLQLATPLGAADFKVLLAAPLVNLAALVEAAYVVAGFHGRTAELDARRSAARAEMRAMAPRHEPSPLAGFLRQYSGEHDRTVKPPVPGRYCRNCDVFIGHEAIGVVRQPEGKTDEWLADHCWLCGRHADQLCGADHAGRQCGRVRPCPIHTSGA